MKFHPFASYLGLILATCEIRGFLTLFACFGWKELLSSCFLFILQSALTGVDAPENEVDLEIQS